MTGAGLNSFLNREAAVARMGGDEELYEEILQVFFEDVPKQLALLEEAFAAGDQEVAERQAHSLKSAAGNIGGDAMRAACFECEKAFRARNATPERLRELCDGIASSFAQLQTHFQR